MMTEKGKRAAYTLEFKLEAVRVMQGGQAKALTLFSKRFDHLPGCLARQSTLPDMPAIDRTAGDGNGRCRRRVEALAIQE